MTLAKQWSEIDTGLPDDWTVADVVLTVSQDERVERAALLLTPFTPGRRGNAFRLRVARGVPAARVLSRLDREGIRGRLDLATSEARPPEPHPPHREHEPPLAEQWEEAIGRFPPDWSDLYAEVELDSSDYLQRGALLLAPVNPAHYGGPTTLRFRVARVSGYGAAASMAKRCLERLDRERITGRFRVLRVLSATSHVATQGPVWRVGGRSV
jgi:hypothetical protein